MKKEETYKKLIHDYLKVNGKTTVSNLFEYINNHKSSIGKTGRKYLREVVTNRYKGSDMFEYNRPYVWLKNAKVGKESTPPENTTGTFKEKYEGELKERNFLSRKRNTMVVKEAKNRDSFTCQICDFHYKRMVVEAHHLNPVSEAGETKISKDDLITLCPNCHALAHCLLKQSPVYTDKNNLIQELCKLRDIKND